MALAYSPEVQLGTLCPDFALPGTDGRVYRRDDFLPTRAFLAMFICNHCPYVLAVEDRLIELGREMQSQNVAIAAFCANDAARFPADSFEKMKERAQAKNYPFPYLHDVTQEVARAFGAVCTPDFFLFDHKLQLAYRGRLDDSWKDPAQVRSRELKTAIEALLNGTQPSETQRPAMGCSIKWKEI